MMPCAIDSSFEQSYTGQTEYQDAQAYTAMVNERNAHGDRPGRRQCLASLDRRRGEVSEPETVVGSAAALATKTGMGPIDSSTELASFAQALVSGPQVLHPRGSVWAPDCSLVKAGEMSMRARH